MQNGKHKWYSDRKQTTIWNFDKPKRNANHPTSKPLDLLGYPIGKPEGGKKNGLHAGKLKSYIQLCLAMSQMAKDLRSASPKEQQKENKKFAMRTWLMRMGFIGDEFATARETLTQNLTGDNAFRFGRP